MKPVLRALAYRCDVCLTREEDGSFLADVLNLPGAASEGATEEDAMRNVEESIRGLIEFYNANGDPIPWKNTSDQEIPSGAKLQRILVNA